MKRPMRFMLFSLAFAVLAACASAQLRSDFDQTYTRYNELVRWNDMERAAPFFSSSVSEAFRERAKAAKNVKVIDFREVSVRYDAQSMEATVEIAFDYYVLNSPLMKSVSDKQRWVFRDENGTKKWRLESPPPEFK